MKTNTSQETVGHRLFFFPFVLKELGDTVTMWFCENRKDEFLEKEIKQPVQLQTRYSPTGFAVGFGYAAVINDVLKMSRVLQRDTRMGLTLSREPCM